MASDEDPVAIPILRGFGAARSNVVSLDPTGPISESDNLPTIEHAGSSRGTPGEAGGADSAGLEAQRRAPADVATATAPPSPVPAGRSTAVGVVRVVAIWPVTTSMGPKRMRLGCWDPQGQIVFWSAYALVLLTVNVAAAVGAWKLHSEGDQSAALAFCAFFLSSGVILVAGGALFVAILVLDLLCKLACAGYSSNDPRRKGCCSRGGGCSSESIGFMNCTTCSGEACIFFLALALFALAACLVPALASILLR